MTKPKFSRITWKGEQDQHLIPAAAQIVPGVAVLCGKRAPDVFGEKNETEEQIETPMSRRCSLAHTKIYGRIAPSRSWKRSRRRP